MKTIRFTTGEKIMLQIQWYAPFTFVPQVGQKCVFDDALSAKAGLYLWAIEYDSAYLAHYVGMTGRSFSVRLAEDIQWSLAGNDKSISYPDDFAQGKRRTMATFNFKEFLADYPRLSTAIWQCYRSLQVFLAPAKLEKTKCEFIEAALIRNLTAAGGEVSDFLCNQRKLGPATDSFDVEMKWPAQIRGLDSLIKC